MRSSCIPSLPVSFKKHGERGRTPEGKYTLLHAYSKYFFVSNASKHHAARRNFFCGRSYRARSSTPDINRTDRRSPSELVAVGRSRLQELGTSSLKVHRKSHGYSNTQDLLDGEIQFNLSACFLRLLDHLVRSYQHIRRNRQADLLRCFQVDDELELLRLLHGEVSGLGSL